MNIPTTRPPLITYPCVQGTKSFTEQGRDETTQYLMNDTTQHTKRLSTPSLGMPYFCDGIEARMFCNGLRVDRLKRADQKKWNENGLTVIFVPD